MSRPTAWLLALALAALACSREAPGSDFPGMRLLEHAEARLARERDALRPMLEHYALVFPVEPADLDAFLRAVRVYGAGPDLALGDEHGLEAHGGGVLRLLFDAWRSAGREATLDDGYPFEGGRRTLSLRTLYEAGREQIVLSNDPEGSLPRLRIGWGEGASRRLVERDAYHLLRVLIDREPDASRAWVNRDGQEVSVALLMRRIRSHYLASRPSPARPRDHSNLHLVELLVAFDARTGARDLEAVQQRFLDGELSQLDFVPADADFLLAHYVESLGHLLGAPGLAWREGEKRRIRRWLEGLEEHRLRDVATQDLDGLCHLTTGLRAVRAHRGGLE